MREILISARGLTRVHARGDASVHALRGVDVDIGCGEYVAITGPSGSGKSTLMHLLGLLDSPSGGSLRFAGDDVTTLDADYRARLRNRRIGFVFQAFNLLPRSRALDNVALPLVYAGVPAARRRRLALERLDAVGLSHRAEHWPHQLSGGEQQRVAIARALVHEPDLVLADEPTGALDRCSGESVMALLGEVHRSGRTVVLVTHEASVAARAQRHLGLEDGRVRADGPAGGSPGVAGNTRCGEPGRGPVC